MQNPDDLLRSREIELGEPVGRDASTVGERDLLDSSSPRPLTATPSGGEVGLATAGMCDSIFRVFVENKLAVVGVVIIVFVVLFCYLGPLFYHTNQTNAQTRSSTRPRTHRPANGNPLGTDGNGFDILGRLMYGGQISLMVGFAAAAIATRLRRALRGRSPGSSAAGSTRS